MDRKVVALAAVVMAMSSPVAARAIEVKVSAAALERTLKTQLFNDIEGRHYIKGSAKAACSVYADKPEVSFKDDRVVVHVHTLSKLGKSMGGACLGITISKDAYVSFIPEAEGESVGFRDARIEKLSGNAELDFLLTPFLSRKLPTQMKVNAAELMRTLLMKAPEATGYKLTLESLKIHSMIVDKNDLVVDLDANLRVE